MCLTRLPALQHMPHCLTCGMHVLHGFIQLDGNAPSPNLPVDEMFHAFSRAQHPALVGMNDGTIRAPGTHCCSISLCMAQFRCVVSRASKPVDQAQQLSEWVRSRPA